ncbi:MAG: hypothetical protein E7385_04750 [Ruminococcaceae bacterium]|nr:hypothetical protein [Oscillospiraceae bacterium]
MINIREEIGRLHKQALQDLEKLYNKVNISIGAPCVKFFPRKVIRTIKGVRYVYVYKFPHLKYTDKKGKVKYRYMKKSEFEKRHEEIENYLFLQARIKTLEFTVKTYEELLVSIMNCPYNEIHPDESASLSDAIKTAQNHRKRHTEYRVKRGFGTYTCKNERGDFFASRGEMILNSVLCDCGLVSCYEEPFIGEVTGCQYLPDFTIIRGGQKILVELFGVMDDPEYVSRTHTKLIDYFDNGYVLGKNLICFCACGKSNLDIEPMYSALARFSATGELPIDLVWLTMPDDCAIHWDLPSDLKEKIKYEMSLIEKTKPRHKYISRQILK